MSETAGGGAMSDRDDNAGVGSHRVDSSTPNTRTSAQCGATDRGETCGAANNAWGVGTADDGAADTGRAGPPIPDGRRTGDNPAGIRAGQGAERLLRPFAVTIGGTTTDAPGPRLDLLSIVTATRPPGPPDSLRPERETILLRSREPQSIVELAAHLELPVSVVKLLAAGMIAEGALRLHVPEPEENLTGLPLLYTLLEGLRAL
ncbi:hypothetical protein GCM10009799_51620 [Nocardiopsis rhodophaea]|uniref:DUF742 domain-containing protein n=1 Tax=Nocardiopsis rhodophaea TaxID=280238 RepID=A0ABN2TRC2_9ACTN